VLTAQRISPVSHGLVNPAALTGVASDGRDLMTLLYQPVITALVGIGSGNDVPRALASGRSVLDMIVRTQVADAGRAADQVAMAARPQVTGYVRMLVGRSCSRCAILAGRHYSWQADFKRHPRCDCTAVPAREDTADDLRTDPRRYFDSLSTAEQSRQFTVAGAEAIRSGADIAQVVNARSGMYSAAGQSLTDGGRDPWPGRDSAHAGADPARGRRPRRSPPPAQTLRLPDSDGGLHVARSPLAAPVLGTAELPLILHRLSHRIHHLEEAMATATEQLTALSTKVDDLISDVRAALAVINDDELSPDAQSALDGLSDKIAAFDTEVGDADGSDTPAPVDPETPTDV
jgi:hypothetical protein